MNPLISSIIMFAGNLAPKGWALCDGQLLAINEYSALFSILGTTFGGDGRTTFALPDLRGRAPINTGQDPGLTDRKLDQKDGEEEVTLRPNQLLDGLAHEEQMERTFGNISYIICTFDVLPETN